jgi:hypothetical protein
VHVPAGDGDIFKDEAQELLAPLVVHGGKASLTRVTKSAIRDCRWLRWLREQCCWRIVCCCCWRDC